MSHSTERVEKICLNCGASLAGRYCHLCGQENIEPRQSFWTLVSHFFSDLTHFDGKFFTTVITLIRKPGLLAREYISGKRIRYLHPIRMYLFSSALFFIVFYAISSDIGFSIRSGDKYNDKTADSLKGNSIEFTGMKNVYTRVGQYDSIQKTLPKNKRDNWIVRKLTHRGLQINEKYKGREGTLEGNLFDSFLHSFPYLLFVSLPLFAFYLKLLYFRRKSYYYTSHAIFLIYLYIFAFLLLLLWIALTKAAGFFHIQWLNYVKYALILYGVRYTFVSMKRFYEQGSGKTFLKFSIMFFISLFTTFILFNLFFVLTLFRV